ncbi:alpha/beta-hydrolase, partial [Aureobasidium melanogenum]
MLHGRDSVASELAEELFESQASDSRTLPQIYSGFKWMFPNSGLLKSERFGMELSQWFDMWSTEKPHDEEEMNRAGIEKAVARIVELIKSETALVPLGHIFLGGISQGAAVAIHSLLRSGLQIGGYMGFCTWLPLHDEVQSRTPISTPIFLAHNKDDEVISIDNGERMQGVLQHLGLGVTWRTYETGGHWPNEPQGIDDLIAFLTACGVSITDQSTPMDL